MLAQNTDVNLQDQNNVFPVLGKALFVQGNGFMLAWGKGTPHAGSTGYGKGCLYQNTGLTGLGDCMYVNIGSSSAASWKAITVSS